IVRVGGVVSGILESLDEIVPVLHSLDVRTIPADPIIRSLLEGLEAKVVLAPGGEPEQVIEPGVLDVEPTALVRGQGEKAEDIPQLKRACHLIQGFDGGIKVVLVILGLSAILDLLGLGGE